MAQRIQDTAAWLICVDTGGTFTDCLARDPKGNWHRAKVLSSSALRGTVWDSAGSDAIFIDDQWNAPTHFADGFTFHLLDGTGFTATVKGHKPGFLLLDQKLPSGVPSGTPFEVVAPYEAPILAARLVTRTMYRFPLPSHIMRLATTRGTNALLTRTGTPPAFFVTEGHADLLTIGTQQRPDLFALDIHRPDPLYASVIEVPERLSAGGTVLRPLDETAVQEAATRLLAVGIDTAAICLLHAYRNPAHEERVAAILNEAGFRHVSVSSTLAPFIKALPRAQTTVVNAYLAPIMDAYVGNVRAVATSFPPPFQPHADATFPINAANRLYLMTSAGGLVSAEDFRPKDSLLSGPAGGIVGAAVSGQRAGYTRLIAFDMGGTSTDVARFDGTFEYSFEHAVGDAHLVAPALAIESVAAGGGSLCLCDTQGLRVGPESAGANPGPACYGAGGPLTITDVNLSLGRVLPERFGIPLSIAAAETALENVRRAVVQETGSDVTREALLHRFLDIANERMADAIRKVSVRRGYDPAEYALLSFGGAGGQHACAVASRLGMTTVIVPPDASLLSAFGLANAALERFVEKQILTRLGGEGITETALVTLCEQLQAEAIALLPTDEAGIQPSLRWLVRLRLIGQESTIDLEWEGQASLEELFAERYRVLYGHPPATGRAIEIESVRVVASLPSSTTEDNVASVVAPNGTETVAVGTPPNGYPIYERDQLPGDTVILGPALIVEQHSVIVVEEGWQCRVHPESGALLLDRIVVGSQAQATPVAATEELFAARFTAIAEEMGEMLRRTALSTNVKERLDYSCAVLDSDGDLIASAAHIPVHLGAMSACVRRVRETVPDLKPGDVVVTNHPAFGGSHLPDITLVSPVFGAPGKLFAFVANRAHHAEIGGTRPGSMPPDATTLAEEGVVIPPTLLVQQGASRMDALCNLLTTARYPTRSVADNRADLEAALAANHRGVTELVALAARYGTATVTEYMETITARSERLVRAALRQFPAGRYTATEAMDDGAILSVAITIDGETAIIDFAGTSGRHPGNRNAPPAVTRSAVLYVLRLLIGEPIPLNEGLLRPITLALPPDTLVNPTFDATDPTRCPAVVGGNVETSQRIVDTLLKALGMCAASQGTMNNTLWGNATTGYYETVCGGAGATANGPGAPAVHTHMTNTRITDVEVVEHRYPVRIERFARRYGSGGAGQHPGGDGIIRETVFLAPMALSLLTERRQSGPYGMAGGEPGQPGRQTLVRTDGTVHELRSTDGADVHPGDRLILETPGGGGWGEA